MDPMRVPLESLIEQRHSDPSQWVVIRELRAGVGFSHRGVDRAIDVAAFNCWPSKGLHRIAYEVKRSRGDFVREIENPKKREWVEKNFHQTYFAASHGVCKPEEVPESWGLFVATKAGDKLRRAKIATHREIEALPELIALSAIRSLSEEYVKRTRRHYYFEGMWIRQEQLDEIIKAALDEELAPARVSLQRLTENAAAEATQYRDKRLELHEPLRLLAREVGQYLRFDRGGRDNPVTVEEVEGWIKAVRSRAIRPVLAQLEGCASSIQEVLRQANENGLESNSRRISPHRRH